MVCSRHVIDAAAVFIERDESWPGQPVVMVDSKQG